MDFFFLNGYRFFGMNRGEEGSWEEVEKFGIVGAEERGGEVEREVEEERG
jgi:hypothetical protein